MEIYLIVMAVAFAGFVFLNMRVGLDRSWLVATLVTLAVLLASVFIVEFVACKIDPGPLCGIYPLMIWMYVAPALLNIQQLLYLVRRKRRLT